MIKPWMFIPQAAGTTYVFGPYINADSDSAAWNGYTLRLIIPTAELLVNASSFYVKLEYRAAQWAFTKCYVGHQAASGDTYDFAAMPNIVTGGTASADSEYDANYPASKACDGSTTGNAWSSTNTSYPHWWKYDLGAGVTKTVTSLSIFPYRTVDNAYDMKNFVFAGSNDNTDWTTIYTGIVPNTANPGGWETFYFQNSTAYRYYRITGSDSWSARNYMQIYEVEMYESGHRVPVLFSGNNGATVDPGGLVSDLVYFPIDKTKKLIFSFYFADAAKDDVPIRGDSSGYNAYYKSGDDTATVNATGYSASAQDGKRFCIGSIYLA